VWPSLGMADALIARLSGLTRLTVKPTSAVAGTLGLPAEEAGRKPSLKNAGTSRIELVEFELK
jgi:hypothetical protein